MTSSCLWAWESFLVEAGILGALREGRQSLLDQWLQDMGG